MGAPFKSFFAKGLFSPSHHTTPSFPRPPPPHFRLLRPTINLIFPSKLAWRNGNAPAYGAGDCGFESHRGRFRLETVIFFFSVWPIVVASNPNPRTLSAVLGPSKNRVTEKNKQMQLVRRCDEMRWKVRGASDPPCRRGVQQMISIFFFLSSASINAHLYHLRSPPCRGWLRRPERNSNTPANVNAIGAFDSKAKKTRRTKKKNRRNDGEGGREALCFFFVQQLVTGDAFPLTNKLIME
jgi:hypothetical protein